MATNQFPNRNPGQWPELRQDGRLIFIILPISILLLDVSNWNLYALNWTVIVLVLWLDDCSNILMSAARYSFYVIVVWWRHNRLCEAMVLVFFVFFVEFSVFCFEDIMYYYVLFDIEYCFCGDVSLHAAVFIRKFVVMMQWICCGYDDSVICYCNIHNKQLFSWFRSVAGITIKMFVQST